jgi:hypothetical protein
LLSGSCERHMYPLQGQTDNGAAKNLGVVGQNLVGQRMTNMLGEAAKSPLDEFNIQSETERRMRF